MTTENTTNQGSAVVRGLVIGALVIAAFFGAYKFASALNAPSAPAQAAPVPGAAQQAANGQTGGTVQGAGGSQFKSACGGGCCGGSGQSTANGVTGTEVPATAKVVGGVQKVAVDVTNGTYSPNAITLKAGVPAEITFGQSTGCTGQVQSNDLGFFEDLTTGPKTVKLENLKPGTYAFSCGMQMVFGKIIVE